MWRIKINRHKIKANTLTSLGKGKTKEKTKKDKPSKSDARETNRKIKKIISHNPSEIESTNHKLGKIILNPQIEPIEVATPLPPLNFKNIGQLCPHTLNMAANIYIELAEARKTLASNKGKKPFKKSRIKTKMPHFFPTTLTTLVAPILPEPNFRMSMPFTR